MKQFFLRTCFGCFVLFVFLQIFIAIIMRCFHLGPLSREELTLYQMGMIKSALINFKIDTGFFPETVGIGEIKNLMGYGIASNCLYIQPKNFYGQPLSKWNGPYIEDPAEDYFIDAWSNKIIFVVIKSPSFFGSILVSSGKNLIFDTKEFSLLNRNEVREPKFITDWPEITSDDLSLEIFKTPLK